MLSLDRILNAFWAGSLAEVVLTCDRGSSAGVLGLSFGSFLSVRVVGGTGVEVR